MNNAQISDANREFYTRKQPSTQSNPIQTSGKWSEKVFTSKIKLALASAGVGLVALLIGAGAAAFVIPPENNSQIQAIVEDRSVDQKPIKIASAGVLAVIPGTSSNTLRQIKTAETIVPRQAESGLNPYAKTQRLPARQKSLPAPLPVPDFQAPVSSQKNTGLSKLTDNVVSTLERLKKQENKKDTENLTTTTKDLREAISALVTQATTKGKSGAYIQTLINDALAGRDAVPSALANSDGKLDTRLLLATVLPTKNITKVGKPDSEYLSTLESESRVLSSKNLNDDKTNRKTKKRYIIVRLGDNLSKIAMRAYGDPLAYPKIYRANKKLLINANTVDIGQRLLIPR